MEISDYVDCRLGVPFAFAIRDCGLDIGPIGAEWFDQRGDDEALDVLAWGVMGTEGVALGGVEGTL